MSAVPTRDPHTPPQGAEVCFSEPDVHAKPGTAVRAQRVPDRRAGGARGSSAAGAHRWLHLCLRCKLSRPLTYGPSPWTLDPARPNKPLTSPSKGPLRQNSVPDPWAPSPVTALLTSLPLSSQLFWPLPLSSRGSGLTHISGLTPFPGSLPLTHTHTDTDTHTPFWLFHRSTLIR